MKRSELKTLIRDIIEESYSTKVGGDAVIELDLTDFVIALKNKYSNRVIHESTDDNKIYIKINGDNESSLRDEILDTIGTVVLAPF